MKTKFDEEIEASQHWMDKKELDRTLGLTPARHKTTLPGIPALSPATGKTGPSIPVRTKRIAGRTWYNREDVARARAYIDDIIAGLGEHLASDDLVLEVGPDYSGDIDTDW